jgi:NADH dehydrogenase FAD-containing subunit
VNEIATGKPAVPGRLDDADRLADISQGIRRRDLRARVLERLDLQAVVGGGLAGIDATARLVAVTPRTNHATDDDVADGRAVPIA